MIIFPAIDIIDGKAVRLYRGDYSRMTVYSDDPAGVAVSFREAGAEAVHIVDLDGARAGGTPNFETVAKIKEKSGLFCEVGGGVRSLGVIRKYIDAGIDRVIIGTAAVTNPPMLIEATALYGGRIPPLCTWTLPVSLFAAPTAFVPEARKPPENVLSAWR